MARIQLTTLGRTELAVDGSAILSVLAQPKRFALLVYLAIEGSDGLVRRDTVAALFWPEHDQADARANFRKSLYFLRRSLGQAVLVTRGDEEVGVDPSRLSCDVVTLLSGGDVPVAGPFLEGFHFSGAPLAWEEWLNGVRVRVRAHAHAPGAGAQEPATSADLAAQGPVPAQGPVAAQGPVDEAPGDAGRPSRVRRWRFAVIGIGTVAVLFAAGWRLDLLPPAGGETATRYDRIRLGTGRQFSTVVQRHYALPPDGSGILFLDDVEGISGAWWKPLDSLEPAHLPGLGVISGPVFSPDGAWLAYARAGQLLKQRWTGGPPMVLAESVSDDFSPGLAWLPGGDLLFEDRDHDLRMAREEGGATRLVATAAQVGEVFHVAVASGDEGALVTGCEPSCGESDSPTLSYVDLDGDRVVRLRSGVWMAWPMSDGRLLMVNGEGTVSAATFDPASATLGDPVPLLEGIRVSPFPDAVMGRDGSLLYIPGEVQPRGERLVWVDRHGATETVDPGWPPFGWVRSFALSPDDRRLAIGVRGVQSVGERIWIKDLPDGALRPLTPPSPQGRRPVWSPDGATLAFIVQWQRDDGTWWSDVRTLPADASATEPAPLLEHDRMILEVVMTGEWDTAVVRLGDAAADRGDVAYRAFSADRGWETPFRSPADENEYGITLSPDGRWLAYVSEASGVPEVYVRPFPGTGSPVQLSRGGGVEPRWARDGDEIFFRSLNPDAPLAPETVAMVAVRVSTDPTFRVISARELFSTGGYERGNRAPLYDVTADGLRFIMVTRDRGWTQGQVVYSKGWYWSDQIQTKLRE